MSTSLNIHIVSPSTNTKEKIVFFRDENWTIDSQFQLLQKIYDLIETARPHGSKLDLHLEIEAENAELLISIIKRKLRTTGSINTQKLSKREVEIVGLIMQGLSSEEIGQKLFISYETVKTHRKHILEKTGAKNTAALINYYHQTFFEK